MIQEPCSMFDNLISKLEAMETAEESSTIYKDTFELLTTKLSDDQCALVANENHKIAEAWASGEKYYPSSLTHFVNFNILLVMQDPEKLLKPLPPKLADALLRLDAAEPRAPISVFQCRDCRLGPVVLLRTDCDEFYRECPACDHHGDG